MMSTVGEDSGKNLHVVIQFATDKVLTVYCDHLKAMKNGIRLTILTEYRSIYFPYNNVLFYDIRERGSVFVPLPEGD